MRKPRYLNVSDFRVRLNVPIHTTKDVFARHKETIESIPLEQRKAVDQFKAQEFAMNEFGWPCSDIDLAFKAETQQQFDLALSRLREIRAVSDVNKDKSDSQILSEIVPKWVQTPGERQKYIEFTHSYLVPTETVDEEDSTVAVKAEASQGSEKSAT